MGIEIERKFLVRGEAWRHAAVRAVRMEQGYINDMAALRDGRQRASVRVRIAGDEAFINLKSRELGTTRQEADGLWVGEASPVGDDPVVPPAATHANVVKSLVDAVATLSAQGAEPFLQPHRFEDAGWVANRWCEILPLPLDAKHRLLSLDPLSRLDIVDSLMRVRHTPH